MLEELPDLPPAIYVAGPFGFTEPGREYLYGRVVPALRAAGFEILDPWAFGEEILSPLLGAERARPGDIVEACRALGAANAAAIEASAGVLALLDGVDLDSGTCAELGFAAGIGRVVVGLRTDSRSAGDVAELPVNLQVLHFLESSGGVLATALDEAIGALVDRLLTGA